MKVAIAKWLDDIRSSYWFIPALMALAAIALAFAMVAIDRAVGSRWLYETQWLFGNHPDGARALLAAIAGSMITVAGVTFSVTISSVVYAASQFGPRLLTNFMQDRGNQVTLGTFIAAFIYCLLILRAVRGAGEGGTAAGGEVFVPELAMLGALGFALAGVAVLIYFIHHVPATIHISHVIARIGIELNQQIERLCPERHDATSLQGEAARHQPGVAQMPDPQQLQRQFGIATPVRSRCDAYVQHLDGAGLLGVAGEHQLLIFVTRNPGDFVIAGHPLVYVWPGVALQQEVAGCIRNCFAFGRQRTQAQDLMFLAQELVEIAVRALSPGVNDPATAIKCMNWLAAALSAFARRRPPSPYRFDSDGELRIVYRPLGFVVFIGAVCDGLRPHAKRDRNAALHLLELLAAIAPDVVTVSDRDALLQQVTLFNSACQQALDQQEDRQAVAQSAQQALERIRHPAERHDGFGMQRHADPA